MGAPGDIGWAWELLLLIQRELLLFAGFWLIVGLIDELLMDGTWLALVLLRRPRTTRLAPGYGRTPLAGPMAVLIPAYAESAVIGTTIRHMRRIWPHTAVRFYVGCYANDPATVAAVVAAAEADRRVRVVIHAEAGPTTKADCLNRLYAAMVQDEERGGRRFRGAIIHDAEDMPHPAALQAIDAALGTVDLVQLPVRPVIDPHGRWIGGHYADEFTESHAKALVVRGALGLALPAAGVGCGLSRAGLDRLVSRQQERGGSGPFSPEALTEDYELGLTLSRSGRGSAFLRLRAADGSLVATASYFPDRLDAAVRQKTRWIHGIALQGWERQGWWGNPLELWMALRDRRGPLTALVLAAAYLLLVLNGVAMIAHAAGWTPLLPLTDLEQLMLQLGLVGVCWRAVLRFAFVGREYGWAEGARAVLRMPIANIIAIMAGRRATMAYLRSLRGAEVRWDKTEHLVHPATALAMEQAA